MPSKDTRTKLLDAAFLEVYTHGYHGAGTASILKKAAVPKGSMYHFFNSKKDLVLSVVQEYVSPKMDEFFDFTPQKDETVFQSFERIFTKMSTHELIITHGCPIHRLLVEMAPLDPEFENVLKEIFATFVNRVNTLLQTSVQKGELIAFDTETTARFFITSTWGEISLPPSLSSTESFLKNSQLFLRMLNTYKTLN
jgi:TetR/AcrR family transcriptional repressor of nem operon